jgi:tetratricopeptide (TPR) repeat protein
VKRTTIWDRVKAPGLDRYCHALARGYALLRREPAAALGAADAAARALAGRAAPHALRGRALLWLGRVDQAWRAFERAFKLDKRSVEAPAALHDFAEAAARTSHRAQALWAYRALVPRVALLEDPVRRQRAYVEAAVRVMAAGPAALDEAIGYLTEARRQLCPPGYQAFVLGALALALDRQGRHEQARGVAAEAGGPWGLTRLTEPLGDPTQAVPAPAQRKPTEGIAPVLPDGELRAMIAVLAEREDRELAAEQWRAYLRDDTRAVRAWREHAERKLDQVSSARARRRRGR